MARELVRGTADAFWSGHQLLSAPTSSGMPPAPVPVRPPVAVFSPDPTVSAEQTQPRGIPLELSTQLQAWMTLEAAATLATA